MLWVVAWCHGEDFLRRYDIREHFPILKRPKKYNLSTGSLQPLLLLFCMVSLVLTIRIQFLRNGTFT